MSEKFTEYSELNLSQVNKDVLQKWLENDTFTKSVSTREQRDRYGVRIPV